MLENTTVFLGVGIEANPSQGCETNPGTLQASVSKLNVNIYGITIRKKTEEAWLLGRVARKILFSLKEHS